MECEITRFMYSTPQYYTFYLTFSINDTYLGSILMKRVNDQHLNENIVILNDNLLSVFPVSIFPNKIEQ